MASQLEVPRPTRMVVIDKGLVDDQQVHWLAW
jgi:hypothetical protein